jgi:hypothetical protein
MARQIVVDIIGDSSKLGREFDTAGKQAGGFKNVIKGVGVGLGVGIFDMAAGAIHGVVGALGEADQAYQEDLRSQSALKAALEANIPGFDGNTDAIERRIAAGMKLAFGDEEQRDALANLIATTKDAEQSQDLLAQAMDLARLKGIDLGTAATILGKVATGNTGILSKYGIQLDANATSEEALAAVQQMSAGQAEAYAATKGKQEAAELRVGEAMEKVGSIVNKVSTVVLPVLADAFANVVDWLMKTWTAIEPGVHQLVKQLTPAFKNVMAVVGQVAGVLFNVAKVVLPPLWTAVTTLGSIWGRIFGTIGSVIRALWPTVSGVVSRITDAFSGIVNFIRGLPGKIASAASGMWNGITGAFKSAINAIIAGWNGIQFTIPKIEVAGVSFGGFTIGLPDIPYLHAGGVVPGVPGSDVPAILQAGERVISRSQAGRGDVHIHFHGPVYGDGIEELADRLAMRLRLQGV